MHNRKFWKIQLASLILLLFPHFAHSFPQMGALVLYPAKHITTFQHYINNENNQDAFTTMQNDAKLCKKN